MKFILVLLLIFSIGFLYLMRVKKFEDKKRKIIGLNNNKYNAKYRYK